MKKYITLIVTCSLLLTMVPLSTVQAMLPTGHHEAGKPKDKEKSESSGAKWSGRSSFEERTDKRSRGRVAREQEGRARASFKDSYGMDQSTPKDQYEQKPDGDIPESPTKEEMDEMFGRTHSKTNVKPNDTAAIEQALDEIAETNEVSLPDIEELNQSVSEVRILNRFPVDKEILEYPTPDHPVVLNTGERKRLIKVPLKEGGSVLGELTFDEYNAHCEILLSGLTKLDGKGLPTYYELDHLRGIHSHDLPPEPALFLYKNEAGEVVPIPDVSISVHPNVFNDIIQRVGQTFAIVAYGETVIAQVLSLGNQQSSFVKIGIPSSTTRSEIRELPLNIFVRTDQAEPGEYRPIQYILTDQVQPNRMVDETMHPVEQDIVVGNDFTLTLPDAPEVKGMIEHIDVNQHYPVVFLTIPTSLKNIETVKQKMEQAYIENIPLTQARMEWNGQQVPPIVVIRTGSEVIGGRIEDEEGDWKKVDHWTNILMPRETAEKKIGNWIESLKREEPIEQTLVRLIPKLKASALSQLIQSKNVEPKLVLNLLKDSLRDRVDIMLSPIYDYSMYGVKHNDAYVEKQILSLLDITDSFARNDDMMKPRQSVRQIFERKVDALLHEITSASKPHDLFIFESPQEKTFFARQGQEKQTLQSEAKTFIIHATGLSEADKTTFLSDLPEQYRTDPYTINTTGTQAKEIVEHIGQTVTLTDEGQTFSIPFKVYAIENTKNPFVILYTSKGVTEEQKKLLQLNIPVKQAGKQLAYGHVVYMFGEHNM